MTSSSPSFSSPALRFEKVRKCYERDGKRTLAIEDLSFEVGHGEYVCIVGRTGCGKSTTVSLLLGLTAANSGKVSVLGHDPHLEFAALRGRIACIFQGDRLLPWRSALDNVRLPLEVLGIDERRLSVGPRDWLARVGLADFLHALPHELSGGMRQRVAMARALVCDPSIVIADEAFGRLDEVTGRQLRGEFRALARDAGKTVLHITHSIDEAIAQADRILVFGQHGRLFSSFRVDEAASGAGGIERFRRYLYDQIELSGEPVGRAAHGVA